jgi:hypothetical protein
MKEKAAEGNERQSIDYAHIENTARPIDIT